MAPNLDELIEFRLEVVAVAGAPAELVDLARRYWDVLGVDAEKNRPIWRESIEAIDLAGWGSQVGMAAAAGVVASIPEVACRQCEGPLTLTSRDALRKYLASQSIRCQTCTPNFQTGVGKVLSPSNLARLREAHARKLVREREAVAQQQLIAERRQAISDCHPLEMNLDLAVVSDADVGVCLASLALLTHCDAFDPIPELAGSPTPLAPQYAQIGDYVADILATGLLRIHPTTRPEAFVWEPTEQGGETATLTGSYYPLRVRLYAPFGPNPSAGAQELIASLRAHLDPAHLNGDEPYVLLQVAEELMAGEALCYFEYQLARHRLPDVGEAHRARLSEMLLRAARNFCLGHTYSMAWSAVSAANNVAARRPLMARSSVTTYAVNSLEKKIQEFVDQPTTLLKPYDLLDDVPLSAMTRTLYYAVLGADPRLATLANLRERLSIPV